MGFGTLGKPLRVESFDSEDTEIRRAQVLGGELGILYKVLNLESRRVKRKLLCAWMGSRFPCCVLHALSWNATTWYNK